MTRHLPWTTEREDQLRALCAQRPRLLVKQIAHIMGVSKCAIDGQRRKLGLKERHGQLHTIPDAPTTQPDRESIGWGDMMIRIYETHAPLPIVWFGSMTDYLAMQEMMSHE